MVTIESIRKPGSNYRINFSSEKIRMGFLGPIKLLLTIIFISCGAREESYYETPVEIIPSVVTSAGTRIDHLVCGSGEVTLLFVHGWCINQGYWSYQSDGFCSDYKIVTMDLPGFGASGKNRDDWSIEQYSKDVNELINQLGLENVVLVGHSMGGNIILEAALNNDKVIALVGVDNFKEVGMQFDQQLQEEIRGFLTVLENNFSEVASAYAEGALFHPSTDTMVVQRVIDDILATDSTIAVASLESLFEYTSNEARRLARLKQPLFLINSNNTPTDKEALDKTGVKFQVLEIAGTGHYPMIEKPGEFNKLLKTVLDQVSATI